MLLQRMIHAAFGQGAIRVLIDADTTDLNLFTAAGSPTNAVTVVMKIAAGVAVGATSAVSYALNIGQFPAGSDITIDNYGQILGAGGVANGGTGGGAINAEYPNQSVVIRNHPGANIYAGGGGGGGGGTGGKGGNGGQGYYQQWSGDVFSYPQSPFYFWRHTNDDDGTIDIVGNWNGPAVFSAPNTTAFTQYGNYRRGYFSHTVENASENNSTFHHYYAIAQLQNVYTSGGAGGNGGAGGVGGRGQGYGGSSTAGAAGTEGSSGAGGGTNAGQGGTGGTGGAGGAGGGWGTSGANGSAGNTGATGFSGNYTGGSSGAAGAAGAAGGLAGFYLKKGTANVTLINNGAVAGRLG